MEDFVKELNSCTGTKSIILGNGFGLSYDLAFGEGNFSWSTLLELCDIEEGAPLFALLGDCNFDFELAHQKLTNAVAILERYAPGNELIQVIEREIQELRDQLIVAVANSHPQSFNIDFTTDEGKVKKAKIEACREFLRGFSNVFSLNYDLLLYWVRCFENNYLGQDSFDKIDGELVFVPDEDANFLFPHGALFLFRDGVGAIKSKSGKAYPILARVQENIANGHFPMCVSEGTGEQKLKAIRANSYLLYAYKRIEECAGTIFTFGCSFFEDKDSHIIKAMVKSPCSKIVVGEYKPTEESFHRLSHEFAKVKQELKIEKEVVIADTSGVQIWQP
ncbi:DUF4917 family protein [Pseudomonas stutzeri]|nr:DUF4917 family protein [Stutzerimonas stutzeri]